MLPWEEEPLNTWDMVAANHQIRRKSTGVTEKHFFCAMTKLGRVIEAHGPRAEDVFRSLKTQATAWEGIG